MELLYCFKYSLGKQIKYLLFLVIIWAIKKKWYFGHLTCKMATKISFVAPFRHFYRITLKNGICNGFWTHITVLKYFEWEQHTFWEINRNVCEAAPWNWRKKSLCEKSLPPLNPTRKKFDPPLNMTRKKFDPLKEKKYKVVWITL